MKKFYNFIAGFVAVAGLGATILMATPQPATAQVDVFKPCANGDAAATQVCKGGGKLFGKDSIWNRILNTLTFIIGAVAVLMVVIGGLRYTLSGGDEKAVASAKNTILYAVVGLILAVMSNAIVNFVLTNI